jgi:hypothetical protein
MTRPRVRTVAFDVWFAFGIGLTLAALLLALNPAIR